jgi:hypothetical protein
MNAKRTFALVALLIFMMTITAAQAGPRPGAGARSGGMSRGSMGRPQFGAPRMSAGSFQRPGFQRPVGNFARMNRFANSPQVATNFNRVNFNRANFERANLNRANLNRTTFNRTNVNSPRRDLSRAGNLSRPGLNRSSFNGAGINRSGNWNNWNGRRGDFANRHHEGNWRRDCDNTFVFFDPFWFPGYWPFWYWGYPFYYSFYPYPSAYDSYGYDPYAYSGPGYAVSGEIGYPGGSDYSTEEVYANRPADEEGGAYDGSARTHDSIVARVQERLAHAGYYKGPIDGVQGSRTYYAIRAYQRDHKLRVDGAVSDQLLAEMGLQ